MTDPIDDSDAEEPTLFRDIVAFMAAKKVSTKCPACGSASWDLIGTEDAENSLWPVIPTRGLTVDGNTTRMASRVIIAECNNCGFLRFHSYRTFEKWKAQKNKEGASKEIADE
ncbi:hypothetical protein [Achromobacter sp. RTa]|uniref:hypothetical protein n=1 Tax=Achromobacter sp. RTa TaxID=1532557 RepID=UPI0012E06290|nr:hypothetical protein [Achromobacter sp. RTa]